MISEYKSAGTSTSKLKDDHHRRHPAERANPSRYLEAFIKLMANRWYESCNPSVARSSPFGRSRVPVFFAFLFILIPRFETRHFAVSFTRGATFNKRVLTKFLPAPFSFYSVYLYFFFRCFFAVTNYLLCLEEATFR